jgi:PEP-CTERM motif-containing protein
MQRGEIKVIRQIVVVLAVLMFAMGASAATLHGYCVSPAAPCIDNGTITPTTTNPPFFAFSFSGNASKNGSGDFLLVGLVPDNQNSGFSLTLDGTNTTASSVAGSLVSSTEWNSGFLSAYLTSPKFPHKTHPIDAYLPSTQAVDPGAKGYFVYFFNFGAFNYNTTPDPNFSSGSGAVPQGVVFFATLVNSDGVVTVDTPNSASILEAGAMSSVPEPETLLMFGSGIIGFAAIVRGIGI